MHVLAPFRIVRQFFRPRTLERRPADRWILEAVRDAAVAIRPMTDDELRVHADQLRVLVRGGCASPEPTVIVPAFALVYEATRRTLGIEFFDVQMLAGLTLARGAIAEMATGEGKTLAAAFPAFCIRFVVRVFTLPRKTYTSPSAISTTSGRSSACRRLRGARSRIGRCRSEASGLCMRHYVRHRI